MFVVSLEICIFGQKHAAAPSGSARAPREGGGGAVGSRVYDTHYGSEYGTRSGNAPASCRRKANSNEFGEGSRAQILEGFTELPVASEIQ